MAKYNLFCIAAVLMIYTGCIKADARLNDLVARFKASEETTKGSFGLDSLLDNYDSDREGTHKKSWMKLDGHHQRMSLSSFLDEYYPEALSTEGPRSDSDDGRSDSAEISDFETATTQGPFEVGHRHHHSREKNRRRGPSEVRTTVGPLYESEHGSDRKLFEEPTVPTRHHHRYHRGDGLSPHQPQADSTFSQSFASGYYDYSANSGNTSPSVKNTRLSTTDWRKTAKKLDKNKWTSSNGNNGIIVGTVSKGEAESEVNAHRMVALHVKASKDMGCRLPQPKIIRISDHYPSASKIYFPPCTRLYQCAKDTGCCPNAKRCGAKATQRVELYFYSTSLRHSGSESSTIQIEKLPFYNHTECECQDRTDEMPRDNDRLSSNSVDSTYDEKATTRQVCLCPSEFTLKFLPNGACACDCFDKQKECTKYKRGKEVFSHKDRLCIATNKCVVPMCDYGAYIRRYGRCPKKVERHKSIWSKF